MPREIVPPRVITGYAISRMPESLPARPSRRARPGRVNRSETLPPSIQGMETVTASLTAICPAGPQLDVPSSAARAANVLPAAADRADQERLRLQHACRVEKPLLSIEAARANAMQSDWPNVDRPRAGRRGPRRGGARCGPARGACKWASAGRGTGSGRLERCAAHRSRSRCHR